MFTHHLMQKENKPFLLSSFENALLNSVICSAVQMILGLILPNTVNCHLSSNGKENMYFLIT